LLFSELWSPNPRPSGFFPEFSCELDGYEGGAAKRGISIWFGGSAPAVPAPKLGRKIIFPVLQVSFEIESGEIESGEIESGEIAPGPGFVGVPPGLNHCRGFAKPETRDRKQQIGNKRSETKDPKQKIRNNR
jgi:hypothetical protein